MSTPAARMPSNHPTAGGGQPDIGAILKRASLKGSKIAPPAPSKDTYEPWDARADYQPQLTLNHHHLAGVADMKSGDDRTFLVHGKVTKDEADLAGGKKAHVAHVKIDHVTDVTEHMAPKAQPKTQP